MIAAICTGALSVILGKSLTAIDGINQSNDQPPERASFTRNRRTS